MVDIDAAGLRDVRSLEDLLGFLEDELDWPLNGIELEDVSYEYTPAELGIPEERMPNLNSLRRLRPLAADQPWGVVFAEFAGPRLPITPLRRLLQALVNRKRAGAGADRQTWDLNDLLFFVTTGDGEAVEIHLLAFFDAGEPSPEIRSLPWRPSQSPDLHLDRLANELLPGLEWPANPSDIGAWRGRWRDAFKLRYGEAIRSADRLAETMAATAVEIREQVTAALNSEQGSGPFTELLEEVRRQLVADADEVRFADMCAQTLVYGVLSSRVTDPIGFGASPALSSVPLANDFLSSFFEQVHDHAVALDLEGSGLEQLVADLRETNVEAILDQFGSTAKGGDPVIHFYEEFLTSYDRQLRADAGAFYTPQPVVEFIVRGVDELLRTSFGLDLGIADGSSWAEVANRVGFDVPAGVKPSSPFVSMIDPATGTGTFLVEWLRRAKISFQAGQTAGDWREHARDVVLPAMHAFELMLGPYAIAHLKVALELHGEEVDGDGADILLADTLSHAATELKLESMRDPVAVEGEVAARLKDSERFTVVLGNPPYDREQRSSSKDGRRKGGVVRHGVPGIPPLLNAVTEPMTRAGLGVHIKNLYNDYVYFWRWATWQAVERPPGPGVVAFITASSYLDGVSMGGLRAHLREVFDELWIVDLGGDSRGAHPEENVFDIRTPVAIALGVRTGSSATEDCAVRYTRITGTRSEKLAALGATSVETPAMVEVAGAGLDSFVPTSGAEYFDWPAVADLYPWIHSGCQLKRTWPIGPNESVLRKRWAGLVEGAADVRDDLMRATQFRNSGGRYSPLFGESAQKLKPIGNLRSGDTPERIVQYGYRSFDRQWVIADSRLADRPRPDLWRVASDRQVFMTTLTSTKLGKGPALIVSPYVPDLHHFRGSYGAKDVMPLYRDQIPNCPAGLLRALGSQLGSTVTAEDLLGYVHGLLGTAAFGERFAAELEEAAGSVRVPLTADPELFSRVSAFGRALLWWHTWGERFAPGGKKSLPDRGIEIVEDVTGYPDSFSHDPSKGVLHVGSGRFGPVSPEVWDFEVSGLKVLQSWLGYRMKTRKGKKSSPLDDIRPQRWTFSGELVHLLSILDYTVSVTPEAAQLLDEVVAGELIDASQLPQPTEAERKAPKG